MRDDPVHQSLHVGQVVPAGEGGRQAVGHGAPMPLDRGRFVARRECDGWSMGGPV